MNQRPKSPSEIYQEALNKATAEKPPSERMKESDKKGPLIDFLIKEITPMSKSDSAGH